MEEKWYNYLIANKNFWPHGFTLKRLEKVKKSVFANPDIMWDLLHRHGASSSSPEEMKKSDLELFNHCIGNFACNILYQMMDDGIIKRS